MTETTRTVFDRYEIRKTKKQRADFRAYACEIARREGYACHEEKGALGAVNLVIGDPTKARVVYTAHYDTCARLPFPNFITPTSIGIYLLYQLLIVAAFFLIAGAVGFVLGAIMGALSVVWDIPLPVATGMATGGYYAILLVLCGLMVAGPANPHTANDNTSGVTTLLDLMVAMPAHLRGEVAFIFFDLEEMGMFGSAGYYGKHKAAMQETPVINFDCVSDGDTMLFAVRKKAGSFCPMLEAAFPAADGYEVQVLSKGVFYPSDQAQFPMGIGVAALKKTKRGLLYMNRIHTKKDTIYEEGNIAYLVAGSVRLAEALEEAGDLGENVV